MLFDGTDPISWSERNWNEGRLEWHEADRAPFQEWTEVLGSERLTGALLDWPTHHVPILEMNGDSYCLKQSRLKRGPSLPHTQQLDL
jgi:hypothetical protein